MRQPASGSDRPTLGLGANWRQFALLVLVNAFVGAMVGLERAVIPLLGEAEFGVGSRTAVLSFIASFGLVKAIANYYAGRLSDRMGRKPILVLGWVAALPVPFMVMAAPDWSWIVAANVLLGINQGLAWSTTVIMKIDLVGPARRGLAMGFNESAGYLAVAGAAYLSGVLAAEYGLRPEPFYLGIAFAALGLLLSLVFVKESHGHAKVEAELHPPSHGDGAEGLEDPSSESGTTHPTQGQIFVAASLRDPALATCSHIGLVNNLNDGLAWGLLPLFFIAAGLSITDVGTLAAVYPAVWGLGQLFTGHASDGIGRRPLIVGGMAIQGVALISFVLADGFWPWLGASAALGLGTAMTYPTLIAAVSDRAAPAWRASAVGVYRLWRDLGYVVGALLAGALADAFDTQVAIATVGALTLAAAVLGLVRLPETRVTHG